MAAVSFAFTALKLVVEPGGAVALAALLHGRAPAAEGDTVVVLSGSNVDPDLFARIITASGAA
jgi:threonine dehydratase